MILREFFFLNISLVRNEIFVNINIMINMKYKVVWLFYLCICYGKVIGRLWSCLFLVL